MCFINMVELVCKHISHVFVIMGLKGDIEFFSFKVDFDVVFSFYFEDFAVDELRFLGMVFFHHRNVSPCIRSL